MTSVPAAHALPVRARFATTALFFANGFGIGSWAADIPQIKTMLGLSDAGLSLGLLAMAAGAILSMPFASTLASRLGGTGQAARYMSLGFAVMLCLPGIASGLPLLIVAAFLLGAFNGLMDVSMNAHATVVERGWGAAIMSSFHAAWSCGGLTGASTAGLLIATGLATPWLLAIAGGLILILVVVALPLLGPGEIVEGGGSSFALPERRLLGLCLIALLAMLMEGAMTDWAAVYLTSVIELSPAIAAGGYAAYASAMLLSRLLGDLAVRTFGRMQIIMIGAVLAAVGMLVAVAVPYPIAVMGGFCLVGIGLSNMIPTVFSTSATMGSSSAAGISMAATVGYSGFLLGPPFIGMIASVAGLRASFALLVLTVLAIVPLAAAVRRSASMGS